LFHNIDSSRNINVDVTGQTGQSNQTYAYVSMYIIAVGYNNIDFQLIFSKPTHIGIFKLPDSF
jgi:hypothetical protein